jgi:serine/threonine-protein kinase
MIPAPQLPAVIASRYLPVRLIAKGGMGAVYEVEHARTGERLALKVLLSGVGASADLLERFKREARASARIKSDHVVRVIDADVAPELDGAPFLVMELLEGMDLERKAVSGPPDRAAIVEWLRQVAVAIDKAHRLGIIHRDLKPENLFLTTPEDRPPLVKVLDFGILKMTEDGTGATGTGQLIGTPRYMAPEQATSGARITPATDLFALGLVAYRLLAGESYFRGDPINILAQLLYEPMQPPSERHPSLGKGFDTWFARACHRNPEERFRSAGEQIESLSAVLGLPTLAVTPGAVRLPSASRSAAPVTDRVRTGRARPVIGLVVAGALAAVAIAVLVVTQRRDPGETAAPGPQIAAPAAAPNPPAPVPPPVVPAPAVPAPALPPSVVASPAVPRPPPAGDAARLPAKKKAAAVQREPAAPASAPTPPPTKQPPAGDPYADQK